MKTIITLDKANQPFGFPQLNGSGSLHATGSLFGNASNGFPYSGSANITGSLTITDSLVMAPSSSFVLPLTASASPATGSAYWSGSFLFVYNGTRYMSASFA